MINKKYVMIAISTIIIILSACTTSISDEQFIATNPEAYALGEQVYIQECASCHGENGEGQFPNAPMQPDSTGRIGAPPHNGNGHT